MKRLRREKTLIEIEEVCYQYDYNDKAKALHDSELTDLGYRLKEHIAIDDKIIVTYMRTRIVGKKSVR